MWTRVYVGRQHIAFVRLALLGEVDTIEAFGAQVARFPTGLFRQQDAPFYDMAGKLWLMIATDQAAYLAPNSVASLQKAMWGLLNDAAFPHVLIRAFAQAALRKLADCGALVLLDSKGRP